MSDLMESREFERLVIGCWLLGGPEAVRAAPMPLEDLDGAWGHVHVVRAILGRLDRGEPMDAALVLADLAAAGVAQRVGTDGATGGAYLHTCLSEVPSAAHGPHYAAEVRRRAQRRRIDVLATRMHQAVTTSGEHDDAMDHVARISTQLLTEVDVDTAGDGPLEATWTLGDYLARERKPARIVIPDLIRAQDVWMFLGGEGSGKSWVARQVCASLAAGIHPFRRDEDTLRAEFVPPARSLLVDLEVADDTLQEELDVMTRAVEKRAVEVEGADVEEMGDRMMVWPRPKGLDLREPADVRELRRRLDAHRPRLLAIGPIYKMYSEHRGDGTETAAKAVAKVLDELREEYDIALWIEHHTPKTVNAATGERDGTPMGSNIWMRWPSHGRTMKRIHPASDIFELRPFRGDRGHRTAMPVAIGRNDFGLPWRPFYDAAEVETVRQSLEADQPTRRA